MHSVLVASLYGPDDPPTRNLCRYLEERDIRAHAFFDGPPRVSDVRASNITFLGDSSRYGRLRSVVSCVRWRREVRRANRLRRADAFVSFMFHPLVGVGALPGTRRACCVYDIPSTLHSGPFARLVALRAWMELRRVDVVWSSDELKAGLCSEKAGLSSTPLVCYNVPYSDFIARREIGCHRATMAEWLGRQGVPVGDRTLILLRAGAIGPMGGIEETLGALKRNRDWVFVLMGRPEGKYVSGLRQLISQLGLCDRVAWIIRPTNDEWRMALLGCDAGHLMHLRPNSQPALDVFNLNSPLSTNRLFQYMAASLPIISYGDSRMAPIHSSIPCFGIAEPHGLVDSIDRILREWASDRARIKELGWSGRMAHELTFNWERQFSPIFSNLLNTGNE